MSRIADLGEACDEGIKALKKLIAGTDSNDAGLEQVRLNAAQAAIDAYFNWSTAPDKSQFD